MNSLFSNTRAGTMGGTLLVIISTISSGEIAKTALLACVGAVVSFFVSLLLKWTAGYVRTRQKGDVRRGGEW